MNGPRVLMMAGGTGGHVFPALAVADALRERGAEVVWMGTRAGLESRVVPAAGYRMEWIGVSGLRGKGWRTWLGAPWQLMRAVWQALQLVRRVAPQLVVGMGGFVSGPGGLAAWLLRRPLLVHEQNAAAGLTNRVLARLARTRLQAFPGALPGARVVGNPVRGDILALPAPAQRFGQRSGAVRLLALGGSGGALAINEMLPAALARLPADQRPVVRHQAGRTVDRAQAAYAEHAVAAEVSPFIEDMAEAYAWADLVICRAGALTVAELAAAGLGAILIPYPHAVDDHQTVNGTYLTRRDAAVLVQQRDLDPARLAQLLGELIGDRPRLLAMAEAAHAAAWPDATADITAACLSLAEVRR
ncbi:undecaprenyldiphospho-muramoylpentapeptide beta-N-acetylglucosaminyltransferase [Salinisphaera sp. P385]|uniref:UDP-N-acetylglucosamine--N-acetylmuramyl-(pentapeptide) pyrophosphoryl-undecaprenol N-acetylglucosamine transferase n=1 Tax=Spectribacter acetivorans TaxID=3075603 RepID=A0ABU3B6L6_9GAMM|nr:undecaprenyldiphospho-muramoylpentapeptide beta-N-acetylglucosaminyltransferase [Salinisphaera sp. P385]MDT0618079.1 undecaprenyldiphospho-muramoylpentapeptide beta-N-acetylglucosaminyltransferase [Salinisphaera sp. P385]